MRYLFLEPQAPGGHVFSRIPLPRLGNVLLATLLRDRGHDCRVRIETIRPVTDADLGWADVVGVSTTTSTAPRAYALAARARALGKTVVLGGPHATFLPEEGLGHASYVVRGEGDETLPELAEVLDGGRAPETVPGLSFRGNEGCVHTAPRPFLDDLDRLPSPDFSLVAGWSGRRVTPISTSRGCPFGCKFCSVIPMFGTRYRFHSVERVLDDLARYGRDTAHVFFCDDNFAAHRGRTRALCHGMIDRGLGLNWSAQVRTDVARDPELVSLMARAGCWYVYMGLESINPETLAAYDKRQSVEDIRGAVDTFHRHGIRVHGMFVLGADQDDRRVVRDTVTFARRLAIETAQFLILTPAPGTEFFSEMDRAGRLLTRDWARYDGHHVVYQPARFTAVDLQREVDRATRRFYDLRGATAALLRGRAFDGGLRLYAWREARRAHRSDRGFLRELRDALAGQAEALRSWMPRGPIRRVALSTAEVPEPYRRFLADFLGRLRLQTLELPAGGPDARGRAPLVLLPLLAEGQHAIEGWQRVGALWAARNGDQAMVAVPVHPDQCYRACVQLGVALRRSRGRIRRAYARARRYLEALPGGPGPSGATDAV